MGPILGGILLLAAQAHTLGSGVLLLAMHALGSRNRGVIIFFNWLLIINSRFALPGLG